MSSVAGQQSIDAKDDDGGGVAVPFCERECNREGDKAAGADHEREGSDAATQFVLYQAILRLKRGRKCQSEEALRRDENHLEVY